MYVYNYIYVYIVFFLHKRDIVASCFSIHCILESFDIIPGELTPFLKKNA